MLCFFRAVSANGNTSGLQPEIKSSILLRSTSFIGTLCNGSTTDFDSVSLGSIPSVPAIAKIAHQVEHRSEESGVVGSSPTLGTNNM